MSQSGGDIAITASQLCLQMGSLAAVFLELAPDGQLPRDAMATLVRCANLDFQRKPYPLVEWKDTIQAASSTV